MTRLALLERLKEVQQLPKYAGRDITTISAVLSNEALEKHVVVCEEAAGVTPMFARRSGKEAEQAHPDRV